MESTLTRNGSKTVDENKLDHQHELLDSCRVCMGWALEMEPLFEAENRSILDKIEYCTGLVLKKEDGFPSFICEMCIKSVKEAHSFKTTCLNSDEVFRKLRLLEVKEEVKQEVDDESVTYDQFDDDEIYDEIQVKEECVTKDEERKPKVLRTKEEILEQLKLAQRKRRAKIKGNAALYEKFKRRDRDRYYKQKEAKEILPVNELSTARKNLIRKRNRDNFKAYYVRQKQKKALENIEVINLIESEPEDPKIENNIPLLSILSNNPLLRKLPSNIQVKVMSNNNVKEPKSSKDTNAESGYSSAYKLRSSQKHDNIPRDSHTIDSLNEILKSPNISFSDSDSSQHNSNNQRKITSPSKLILKSDYISDLELLPTRKCRGPYKKKKTGAKKKSKEKKNIPIVNNYKCETCSLEFVYRAEYVKHRKVVHDDCHPESAICELCGRFFHNRSTFHSHMIAHRPQSLECAKCGYKTNWKQDLIKHLLIHDDINLYQCEFCPKTLRTISSLRRHIKKIHENLRPHKCTMCDKSYFERTKLSRHIDSHNSVKRYTCEYCHSMFTRRCYWKKHLEKNHGVVLPREKPGRRSLYEVMQDLGELATKDNTNTYKKLTGISKQV